MPGMMNLLRSSMMSFQCSESVGISLGSNLWRYPGSTEGNTGLLNSRQNQCKITSQQCSLNVYQSDVPTCLECSQSNRPESPPPHDRIHETHLHPFQLWSSDCTLKLFFSVQTISLWQVLIFFYQMITLRRFSANWNSFRYFSDIYCKISSGKKRRLVRKWSVLTEDERIFWLIIDPEREHGYCYLSYYFGTSVRC